MKCSIIISFIFLIIGDSFHRSIFDNLLDDIEESSEDYSDEDDEDIVHTSEELEMISLLVDKLILESLRDQRKLLTTEREAHHHHHHPHNHKRRHHHKHHSKSSTTRKPKNYTSNRDMIPYPRSG